MKLDTLYRDVYSQLNIDENNNPISSIDVVNAINQSISRVITDYANNGMGHFFSETETINNFIQSPDYPFLQEGTLTKAVLNESRPEIAVLASNVKLSDKELLDQAMSWDKGDVVEFEGDLYKAVKPIDNQNTFGKVFSSEDVRPFRSNNGLKYNEGDIVYDDIEESYFRVTQDFIAKNDVEFLEELFWRLLGTANVYANIYPLEDLRNITLHNTQKQAFSIRRNKVFVNENVTGLSITYIPEWTYVEDLEADVDIPYEASALVIQNSVNKLLSKLARQPMGQGQRNEES